MATVASAGVSVVVVSYNTKDVLRRCIQSLDEAAEIVVVDNASTDGSLEMLAEFPGVRVISNEENRGFGAANNQGIKVATQPLVLLLNSDAYATAGGISRLASVFEDESVVAAGGRLLSLDGSTQESCANELTLWAVFCEQLWLEKLFRSSRLFSPYWMSARLLASGDVMPREVSQVMGACLMLRPEELFDERFFLYCEDTELCFRLRTHGKILYVPEAQFYHELGTSSKGFRWKAVAMYNCGKELYFRLHGGTFASRCCFVLDRLGAFLRCGTWFLVNAAYFGTNHRARTAMGAFWRVLWGPKSFEKFRG